MGRIDTQLDIIRLNRYGENVRGAIHDALDILEKTSGGSGGNEPYNAVWSCVGFIGIIGVATKE